MDDKTNLKGVQKEIKKTVFQQVRSVFIKTTVKSIKKDLAFAKS